MYESAAGRSAPVKLTALVLALVLVLLLVQAPPALAAAKVRVTLRTSVTLGLIPGRNNSQTLTATVKTPDGSAAPAVGWKSSAPTVVAVDAAGKLTALRKGTAVIRATADGVTARCLVTVKRLPVRALTLSRKKVTLLAGRDGYRFTSKPTPSNADDPTVTWSSFRPSVASVDAETGFVTPLKAGTTTIQCRAADGTQKKAYATVVVKPVVPTGLTLDQASLEINLGASATLTATVSPADATDSRVIWTSSNPSVAPVSGGAVTGRKYGRATITARTRSGSIRTRCLVRVSYFTTSFRALVVGQETYAETVGPLEGPHVDASLVNSMLLNSDFGGGKSVKVTLKENLTADDLRKELRKMASWGVDADDVTYFYYSGHGSELDPGALVGVDGGTLPVDEVRAYLDELPGTVVVMLDSCYSGWYIRSKSVGTSPKRASVDPEAVTARVVSAFSKGSDGNLSAKSPLAGSATAKGQYVILTSCSSTESSYIIPAASYQGASLFTYHLATGGGVRASNWEAGRLQADANGNKIVSLNELYQYTRARVAASTSLKRAGVKQSVRVWPAGSSFTVLQRTP